MAQFLKFKKDFGLSKHRVTLPESEDMSDDQDDLSSEERTSQKTKSSSPSISQRFSSMTGRVKGLFSKAEHQGSPPAGRQSPAPTREKTADHDQDLINFDDNCSSGRPSPLHSRVVNKDQLFAADGIKGSLDSLKDQYGLTDDDDDDDIVADGDDYLKLVVKSENRDQHITLKKNPEGLGIRLSTGHPPVFITQVEPESEAMLAGIKVTDVILEVNGKNCRNLESSEVSKLLQLKSLIRKSPNLIVRKEMKESSTVVTLIDDSDTEESDDDAFLNMTQDKVSFDEQLFEYDDNKEKFKPMPLLQEENTEIKELTRNEKQQPTDELIDLSENKCSNKQEENSTQVTGSQFSNPSSDGKPKNPPVKKPRGSSNSLDFAAIPATERLGVNVGRYKRDIGNARRRKPTLRSSRPQSSEIKESDFMFGDKLQPYDQKQTRTQSFSSTLESGDKPTPKQKPPVAVKRKSSSGDSTQKSTSQNNIAETPPIEQEKTTQRRFTIGPTPGRGQNMQLLANAASKRAKLRLSIKVSDEKKKVDSLQQETAANTEENASQNDKPKWISSAKNKQENNISKLDPGDNTEDSHNASSTEDKQSMSTGSSKPSVEELKSKFAPPKPPRSKRRSLSPSEENLAAEQKHNNPSSSSPYKPVPTLRKPSVEIKIYGELAETTTKIEPKSEDTKGETLISKPVPAARKPSIGKEKQEKEEKLILSSTNDEPKETVASKPVPAARKPSVGKEKQDLKGEKPIMSSTNDGSKETITTSKPIPAGRKPSIGKEKQDSKGEKPTISSTDDKSKETVANKPIPAARKPSLGKEKEKQISQTVNVTPAKNLAKPTTTLEQADNKIVPKENSQTLDKTTDKESEKVATQNSEPKEEKKQLPVPGSIKSRLAMFERR